MEDAKAIVQRYDAQYQKDCNWRYQWQEIADYVIPRVSNILAATTSGEKLTTKLYDAAGMKAHNDLSSALASAMSNMSIKWFGFKMRQTFLNDLLEVKAWLEACEDIVYTALSQSNFAGEMNEFWELLTAFGTASIYVEEKHGNFGPFNGLLFRTLPVASYVIFENSEGEVDTVMWKIEKTLRAAVQEFGVDALSEKSRERHAKNPDDCITILCAIYPGENNYKDHKWTGRYIEYKEKHELRRDGFFEFPVPTVRWKKDGSELWGRGPAHMALPDIKTLNTAVRLRLKNWAKQTDPPYMQLDDGVIGNPAIKAGSLINVRTKDALTPLVNASRIDFAIQQEERLENKIRNTFFADRITLPNKQYMTAYEVAALREQMQSLLGPTAGRIENEGLSRMLTRVFGLLFRAGELPPPPQAVLEVGGTIDVKYEGPLAKANRSNSMASVQTTLTTVGPIVQIDPTVTDNFDFDETVRGIAEYAGLPAKFLRDKRKVEEKRAQRAQQQQAMMDQQAMVDQSQVARNITPAVKMAEDAGKEEDTSFAPAGGNQ